MPTNGVTGDSLQFLQVVVANSNCKHCCALVLWYGRTHITTERNVEGERGGGGEETETDNDRKETQGGRRERVEGEETETDRDRDRQ